MGSRGNELGRYDERASRLGARSIANTRRSRPLSSFDLRNNRAVASARGRINRPHLRSPLLAWHEGPDWTGIGVLANKRRSAHGRFHTFTFSSANAKSSRTCSASNADIRVGRVAAERAEGRRREPFFSDLLRPHTAINYSPWPSN